MEKEHAPKAQITIPAALQEQQVSWRTPQHLEQPELESADGKPFTWPKQPAQPPQETTVFLQGQMERGMAVVVARELWKDKEKRAQYHRDSQKAYSARQKEADPKGWREKERVKKAKQRALQKEQSQPQEGQRQLGNSS